MRKYGSEEPIQSVDDSAVPEETVEQPAPADEGNEDEHAPLDER